MNTKALLEKRAALIAEMEKMVKACETETRAFNEEETARFADIEKEIRCIDITLDSADLFNSLEKREYKPAASAASDEEIEERAFAAYVRGIEERSDYNMTAGANGAVIPSSIVNKILTKVEDISPIYRDSTHYNVGGTLNIPYYGPDGANQITMAYATEFSTLTATGGKFTSIQLTGYLSAALTKVSKQLINNSAFRIVPFLIDQMALSVAKFIEKELMYGTTSKIVGMSAMTNGVTAAKATSVTADELIDLQESIHDSFQANAYWVMNKKTRTAIRKLKDNDGNYLLNRDVSARWGYTLLGKDVYCSDQCEAMAASKVSIFYGDMSGIACKVAENPEVQVLQEAFATEHAVGILCWMELDGKVENEQKIARMKMGTT